MNFDKISDKYNERKSAPKRKIETVIDEMAVSDSAEEIPVSKIDVFTDSEGRTQPFEIDQTKVAALRTSIAENGLLEPIIVRQLTNGRYQLLAGHHRLAACADAEFVTINAKVVDCDDWGAYQIMVESNIRHGGPKFSDMARIITEYKRNGSEIKENLTNQMLADMFDISERQLYRYLKIDQLSDGIVPMIDDGTISTNSVDDIIKLNNEQQRVLAEYVYSLDKPIKIAKCKKTVDLMLAEPMLNAQELTLRMDTKSKKKKYKNEIFNIACDDLILAQKMKEHTEEELSQLVIELLAKYFKES